MLEFVFEILFFKMVMFFVKFGVIVGVFKIWIEYMDNIDLKIMKK